MKESNKMRVRVMKYAWQLFRTTTLEWRDCMIKAWKVVRLIKEMTKGTVEFMYKKVGGSLRYAKGTLSGILYEPRGKGKTNWSTVRYYDVERQAFRSFRIENLMAG